MKSFAGTASRPTLKHGLILPSNATDGDLFELKASFIPVAETNGRIYQRGLYTFSNGVWVRVSAHNQVSTVIGSSVIEVQRIQQKSCTSVAISDGYLLGAVCITPSNAQCPVSIFGSIQLQALSESSIWIAVFRDNEFVAGYGQTFQSKETKTFPLSFVDFPGTTNQVKYELRIGADTPVDLKVNASSAFPFNGKNHSAIVVSENS